MASPFKYWYEERKAAFDMENQILLDKLSQGINGIEWLVMQVRVTESKKESLERWLDYLKMFNHNDHFAVMRDALVMNEDDFYKKYEFNWWISVSDTITYIHLLKELDYDRYFEFLSSIK